MLIVMQLHYQCLETAALKLFLAAAAAADLEKPLHCQDLCRDRDMILPRQD